MTLTGLLAANNLSDVTSSEKVWDNIGDNFSSGDFEVPIPAFDYDFTESESLNDGISGQELTEFSRNSIATYINSQGLITTAAVNQPRFEYDPVTLTRTGLLLEDSVTNLLPNHIIPTFNATAGKFNSSISTSIETPAGDLSGVRVLTRNSSSTLGPEGATVSLFLNGGVQYTFSIFYKVLSGNPLDGDPAFLLQASSPFEEAKQLLSNSSVISYPNGWKRVFTTLVAPSSRTFATTGLQYSSAQSIAAGASIAYWGMQIEQSPYVSSYIATSGSTATRGADVFTISGNTFNDLYNTSQGTFYIESYKLVALFPLVSLGTSDRWVELDNDPLGVPRTTWSGSVYSWTDVPSVSQSSRSRAILSYGTGLRVGVNGTVSAASPQPPSDLLLTASGISFQGALSRIVYWPQELPQILLGGVTDLSGSELGKIPSSASINLSIKGKDIAALNNVRQASVKDFVFIKGLTSAAQPRLNAALSNTTAIAALNTNSLLLNAPTSSGNYFFSAGLTLSAVSTRINGINAQSISTSPFSGSAATVPILLSSLRPQANWRITEPMTSGTITSPSIAIPFETDDFVLFMKAGQN
jgi:hypothetical protein